MTLLNNLISHWKLNEASGTRDDAHGANDLTDNNTVTSAAGKLGDAAQFVRANSESLSRADNTDLSTGDIDFTLAAWVYLDSKPAVMGLAGKHVGASNYEYVLYYDFATDRFVFGVTSDGTVGTFASVSANNLGSPSTATWYYVVCWHDASANTLNIQVNNGTVDSAGHSAGVFDGTADFQAGAIESPAASFLDGRLDSLSFWKRVLTSDERALLYNGGNGLDYPFALPLRKPRITQPPFPFHMVNQ